MPARTILIVDRDAAFRARLADVLEAEGYAVLQASDAGETLALVAHHPAAIDVLVSSTNVGGRDGVELARQVARLRRETRVLFISTDARPSEPRDGTVAEYPVLFPPFTPQELVEQVARAIASAEPASDPFAWLVSAQTVGAEPIPQDCPAGEAPRPMRYRVVLPLKCRLSGREAWRSGMTENMSATGILFRSDEWPDDAGEWPEPGAAIELIIEVPSHFDGRNADEIRCEGRIVRTESPGGSTVARAVAVALGAYKLLN